VFFYYPTLGSTRAAAVAHSCVRGVARLSNSRTRSLRCAVELRGRVEGGSTARPRRCASLKDR
jgi:hypothetical protein